MKTKYGKEILIGLLAFIFLRVTFIGVSDFAIFSDIFENIVVFVLSVLIGYLVRLYNIRSEIFLMLNQYEQVDGRIRKPIYKFFFKTLEEHLTSRKQICDDNGLILDREDLERFVSACFRSTKGPYQGTDSNVPSGYKVLYPNYLDIQAGGRTTVNDTRILLASEQDLRNDIENNKTVFETFFKFHIINSIALLQVDPTIANKIASTQRLPSPDIGLFNGEFIAFFTPISDSGNNKYKVKLYSLDEESSSQIKNYLLMLNQHAKDLRYDEGKLNLKERENRTIQKHEDRLTQNLKVN